MAKMSEYSFAWTYNRHDRKRGTQPPDYECRNRQCQANLHEVGIHVHEAARYLSGRYMPGLTDGGAIIEVEIYSDYHAGVCCNECGATQPHLYLEEVAFDPNAVTEAEEAQMNFDEADPETEARYARLILAL